jgi:hypothetical protein
MPPILTIRNITLSQVDLNDFSYSISPIHEIEIDDTLKKSITRYGVLHPPIVRENNSGLYSIVAGRKRLYALRSLQKKGTCCCLTLSHQTPEIEVFRILLAEVQLDRQLTIVEKAIFLQKITPIADERQIAKEFMPRLSLASDTFAMQQTRKLLELEDHIILGMHQGYVNQTIAHDFISLSVRDRSTLFEIIASLKPSFSNQKKLIDICRELAGRENTSIAALLDNHEVYAILHHQDANPPQKTKNLMTWLSRKHKPRTLQAEEEFSRFISAIRLPKNVSVAHTPFFEDDAVTLSITFRNRESLQKTWEKINHATRDNDN